MDAASFAQAVGRIETLLQTLEQSADPAVRAGARELVQAILALHGAGLAKIRSLLEQTGAPGQTILDAGTADDLVSNLLLLHDLHPLDLESRVRQALERVRTQGIPVELTALTGGTARLRVPDGALAAWRPVLEQALYAAAPDLIDIEIDGLPKPPVERTDLFPLPLFSNGRGRP